MPPSPSALRSQVLAAVHRGEFSVVAISASTGISRTSVYRYLQSLERCRLVESRPKPCVEGNGKHRVWSAVVPPKPLWQQALEARAAGKAA